MGVFKNINYNSSKSKKTSGTIERICTSKRNVIIAQILCLNSEQY